MSQFIKIAGGVVYATAIYGVLLFVPAWTLHWWQGWVFTGTVSAVAAITLPYLSSIQPDLVRERYKPPIQKGQPLSDKVLTILLLVTYLGQMVFIPLDVFHFHLLGGPGLPLATFGLILFVAGWTLLVLAMRENAFAVLVVRHQEERGQVVVQTGPYRIVRHPMYAAIFPLAVGQALWLGSYAAALAAVAPIAGIVLRLLAEERFLRRELPGYTEYARKVRWRLVPFIW